jgi:hypothetical protein
MSSPLIVRSGPITVGALRALARASPVDCAPGAGGGDEPLSFEPGSDFLNMNFPLHFGSWLPIVRAHKNIATDDKRTCSGVGATGD